jgi:hypothetical protein
MNFNQFAIASSSDTKWLLNSSALLGRPLTLTTDNARWWGLVRLLETTFGLTLARAAAAATRALAKENDDVVTEVAEDLSGAATLSVDRFRYDTTFLANLSRARVRETPKRRGRRAVLSGDPIERAKVYGLDIGLMQSALKRTPGERLALLDSNREFAYEMKISRRRR